MGSFSFFEHGTQPDHGTPTFVLDAGPVLRALNIEGGDLEVDVVLTPIENGRAGTGRLTVRRMELRIVRDVVQKAAR